MDEWVKFMDERIVPFVKAKGMKVHTVFRGAEEPGSYIGIRSFKHEAERVSLIEAVYGSEEGQKTIKPTVLRFSISLTTKSTPCMQHRLLHPHRWRVSTSTIISSSGPVRPVLHTANGLLRGHQGYALRDRHHRVDR